MKRGKKRGVVIAVVVVVIAVLILIWTLSTKNTTGNATFTQGASYGPLSSDFDRYSSCAYITEDNGWDVTVKGTVQYYDKQLDEFESISDVCTDDNNLIKYNCYNNYRYRRHVVCPSDSICIDGACVQQ